MAYPHEVDDSGVVVTKNINANQAAGDPEEAAAVTGREPDTAEENTTFGSRKAISGRQVENKSVSSSMTKAELLDQAAARGVEVDDSMTKADILAALERA